MLLIEIALTVWAWKRGWRGKALIPLACVFALGIIIGIVMAVNGEDVSMENLGPAAFFDVIVVIVLIIMIIKKRNPKSPLPPPPVS